jgi:PPP family 3-phenylpropionic acid transporter
MLFLRLLYRLSDMPSDQSQFRGIPLSLFVVMTLQFAVGGAVLPFMSMWLEEKGLSFSEISLVFSVASTTFLVFPFLWGMVADRFLPIEWLFFILNALAACSMWFLQQQHQLAGLMLGFVFFYSFYHPTFTLINALSFQYLTQPREQFGALRAWGSVGWILPSLLVFVWLWRFPETSLEFVLKVGMVSCAMTAWSTFLLPRQAKEVTTSGDSTGGYWQALKKLLREPDYLVLLGAFFLVSASFSFVVYYGPPYLKANGVKTAWIGPIQCIGVLLEIVLFPFLKTYIRRWGFALTLMIGCVCLLLRHLVYYFSTDPLMLSLSYLLAGMVIVFFHIVASILVNTMAAREIRATAQTMLVVFGSGLGPMLSNYLASLLTQQTGNSLRPVFGLGMVLAGCACLLLVTRYRVLSRYHLNESAAKPG